MKLSLANKVVVVTGASAGVGRAAARAFAARGAHVALLARDRGRLGVATREVEAFGSRALPVPLDVADAQAVELATETIERDLGPIDVWVNDAMVSVFARFIDVTAAELRRVTEVTYLGYAYGTQAALRRMLPRNRGTIVQVGSALAYRSIPLQSAYCAAKHAIHGLSESIRTELRHDKSDVHLCEVELPAINTPQFSWSRTKLPSRPQPVPPIFQPELAADAIVYAAEHRRREIWLAWPVIKAILSEKVTPRLGDRVLASRGFEAQLTGEPLRADRQDDLMSPVPGDHGAHGAFDGRARPHSAAWWVSKHRGILGAAALALAASAVAAYYVHSWA
jgi:NAD(P)-dependent dehydrogenase (short-subunit alcohol dehydrogenase family)